MTGEFLCDLDDEILKNDLEITKGLVRKQFLKAMSKYRSEGVPIELITPAEMPKQITEEIKKQLPEETSELISEATPELITEAIPELITEATPELITVATPELITEATPVATETPIKKNPERKKLNTLLKKSTKIKGECTSEMEIYSFPTEKIRVNELKEPVYGQNLKKIIIMGETGSGKSTLLNAFVNYAAGVELEDSFRFKLVVDEAERAEDQSNSQTSEISGYLVEDTELDFSIQIWDTPGFGDTGGVERDEEIKKQINELLNLEDFCHAICFVVKASENRLTPTQKYIIDRVLLFFGKDAMTNIFILATYADDNDPEVLGALKNSNLPLDLKRLFLFNNKAIFTSASKRSIMSKHYWDLSKSTTGELFKAIAVAAPFSLNSTKGVIEEREDLTRNLKAMSTQIDRTVLKISEWEKTLEDLDAQKEEVIKTGKFIRNESNLKRTLTETQNENTICKKCSTNCHECCGSWGMYFCDKFYWDWDWTCKICNCKYDQHHKVKYKYEVTMETHEVIDNNLKAQHDQALGNLAHFEVLKNKFEQEKVQEHNILNKMVERVKKSMKKLKETAILNYSMDMVMYFQTLANSEREKQNEEKAILYENMAEKEKMLMKCSNMDCNEMIEEKRSQTSKQTN